MSYDLDRIREAILRSEARGQFAPRQFVPQPVRKNGALGITLTEIASEETGDITEQYYNPVSDIWENTGKTLEVYNYFSNSIASGTKVICLFVNGALHVVSTDCPSS